MNFVSRNGSRVVIRQIPFLLLFVTGLFSLPMLAYSLFHLVRGTDADGIFFCLVFGLSMLWLFLEFVATREQIEIDLDRKRMTRIVSGVFRTRKQEIDLQPITKIALEIKPDSRGRNRQYVYVYGSKETYLLNTPGKVYINHGKLAKLISDETLIPFESAQGTQLQGKQFSS